MWLPSAASPREQLRGPASRAPQTSSEPPCPQNLWGLRRESQRHPVLSAPHVFTSWGAKSGPLRTRWDKEKQPALCPLTGSSPEHGGVPSQRGADSISAVPGKGSRSREEAWRGGGAAWPQVKAVQQVPEVFSSRLLGRSGDFHRPPPRQLDSLILSRGRS